MFKASNLTTCNHMTHVTATNKKISIKVILIYFPGNLLIYLILTFIHVRDIVRHDTVTF